MKESKYYLQNWKKWKRTVQLLEETRDELMDMKRAIPIGSDNMPGGNHSSVIAKMQKIIDQCDQYNILISNYNFLINSLERAITVLNEEEKEVCIIFSNNPDNSDVREAIASKRGYSRSVFYRKLDDVYVKLDRLLCLSPIMTIDDYDKEIY